MILCLFSFSKSWGQTTIFSENIGNPGATTAITSYSGWQNNGVLTFSGTGDVRTSLPSSGYSGASGNGNVFLTNGSSKTFQICGINTSTCSSMVLTFGVWKSSGTTSNGELQVQFSSDGGATFGAVNSLTVTGGSAWSLQTISSGIPSSSSLCIKFTNTAASTQFRVDDVKLVGSCSSNHTVTFNSNGGSGSMAAQTASVATNLTNNSFTNGSCTFSGWNTAANGLGTAYADGASYGFASDITLYAQWSCGSHTVTFNANGGSGSMTPQTANTTTNLTSNTFTNGSCIFLGWNTAANGSGTSYSNNQAYSFATDITLYAQWNCTIICHIWYLL